LNGSAATELPTGASDALSHSRYFVGKPNIALTLRHVIEAVHCRRRQYTAGVIGGAHFLLYSKDPEADRAFFKTVLEFPSTDLGDGWLLFVLPPAESWPFIPVTPSLCKCMRNIQCWGLCSI